MVIFNSYVKLPEGINVAFFKSYESLNFEPGFVSPNH